MTEAWRQLVSGTADGAAEVLDEPLSLWGGLDPESGIIIDVHHPQRGRVVAATVLVMPFGRGSSSSASTFLEAVRATTNPKALVLAEEDDILVLAAIVARSLYRITVPVVVIPRVKFDSIATGDYVRVEQGGVTVTRDGKPLFALNAWR